MDIDDDDDAISICTFTGLLKVLLCRMGGLCLYIES